MSDTLLTFIHISDTHINPDTRYNKDYAPYTPIIGAKALVESIKNLPFSVDFILHTGDVIYDPHESAYEAVREVFSPIDSPIYYLAGNHDHNDGLQRQLMGCKDADVIPHYHYEFEVNGVQVVCVDSNGPAELPAGNVTDEQLDWLNTLCTAHDDRPMIVAIHHNPIPVDVPWLDNFMGITNGLAFHDVIKQAGDRLLGVFHGHIHQNTSVHREGVLYSSTRSSWANFFSYPNMIDTVEDKGAHPGYSVVMVQQKQAFIRRYWFDVPATDS